MVYEGATTKSCPRPTASHYGDCISKGFHFEFLKTGTYWSTHETMESLVNDIVAPYFEKEKVALGLPPSQKAIWQIDLWSVHHSAKFWNWMKTHHPTIILDYVPAGCTGIMQPCDIGVQHIFKHSLKRSYHEDIVRSISQQIDNGTENILFDKQKAVLGDLSVKWIWDGYNAVNMPETIKKVYCFDIKNILRTLT